MKQPRPNARTYMKLVGVGPWLCFFCTQQVTKIGQKRWDGNVHHLDEDPWNNDPSNLEVVHVLCHRRHHGVPDSARDLISEKMRGRPSPTRGMKFSADVNAKKGRAGALNPMYGVPPSAETLKKIADANRRLITCTDCGVEIAEKWLDRHRRAGCRPKKLITIDGVVRTRGKEPKLRCSDCKKPYAPRWLQRHKDAGRCIPSQM